MSDHVTEIVTRDGTHFEARCSCGWIQGASSRTVAVALTVGHRSYSPEAPVIVTADISQGSSITDDQLRDLFARHCECRPLDLTRDADDHAAIHDCDTGILHDVRVALGLALCDDVSSTQAVDEAIHEARARCAEHWAVDLTRRRGRP